MYNFLVNEEDQHTQEHVHMYDFLVNEEDQHT